MDTYNTEEEQVQAIKQWWKDNAVSIISGLVMGVAVLGGYKYWSESKHSDTQHASVLYSEILSTNDDISIKTEVLKNDYSSTPYAALSALLVAKNNVLAGHADKAIAQLKWVIDNNSDEGIEHIARQRLARLYLSQNNIDAAESLVKGIKVAGYTAVYNEIRGDILLAKKLPVQAKENYRSALSALARGDRRYETLKMKLDDLAQLNQVNKVK